MKVMILGKATRDTEAETPLTAEAMEAMHKFNEALMAAGLLKDMIMGGLKPTRFAKRVHFSNKIPTVIDGPFTETKELVAGFAVWEVKSIDEAIEWVRKSPLTDADVEIRPMYGPEDWDPK